MSPDAELEIMIRARYSLVEIVSSEEERVEECLRRLAAALGKRFCCWSAVRGLYDDALLTSRSSSTVDPKIALSEALKQERPALYLFKDLRPFLSDKVIMRQLKETAMALQSSPKTIFMLETVHDLPQGLDKEVTVFDFPRPTQQELERLLDEVQAELPGAAALPTEVREQLAQAALGLTRREAENALARALITCGRLGAETVAAVLEEKKQTIRKGGLLEYIEGCTGMQAVGGLKGLKSWVNKRTLAFTQEARDFGLPAPRGVLLLGVQGCGKSLCAKAVSAAWQMPILRLDVGRLFTSLIGSSESNMREAIKMAESIAPCVLWIDEIEKAFAGSRGSESDGGTSSRILATFLTWLQEKKDGVFVIATANDISSLPPELLRKGRLDETFFVDLPSAQERAEIFAIHLAKRRRNPALFALDNLALASEGFSGSEIEQAIVAALYEAFDERRDLQNEHILAALRQTVPLSRTRREEVQALREWAAARARSAS
ncbi:MAG: AAA family ATPase [bacterium]|nr:AAA family ATPase [bacterium]